MDRNLPLKPTLAFLACLILMLGVFLYFVPRIAKLPIDQLLETHDGQVLALGGEQLIAVTGKADIALSEHVTQRHIGQLIPLASGGFIVNSQPQSQNIWINIKRLLRLQERQYSDSSLIKCDAQMHHCQSWGQGGLTFKMGWSGLELANQQIIINDSARHRVLLLSENGKILNELDGFFFPNHAVAVNNHVWIVDTNHKELIELSIENDKLVRTGKIIALSDYRGIDARHAWPSIAYLDQNDKWWVMINDDAMAHPGIYRLNDDKTVTRIAKGIDDATAMLLTDSQLYLSNYPDNTLWQFDINSLSGGKITPTSLAALNRDFEQKADAIARQLYLLLAILGTVALGFLIYAIKGSKPVVRETVHLTKPAEVSASLPQKNRDTVWIAKNSSYLGNVKKAKTAVTLLPVSLVSIVIGLLLFTLFANSPIPLSFIFMIPLILLVIVLTKKFLSPVIYSALNIDIGVQDGKLILRDNYTKKVAYVFGKDIVYSKTAFIANNQLFQVINPKAGTHFDSKTFKRYVLPIIQQGERVNEWQLFVKTLGLKS